MNSKSPLKIPPQDELVTQLRDAYEGLVQQGDPLAEFCEEQLSAAPNEEVYTDHRLKMIEVQVERLRATLDLVKAIRRYRCLAQSPKGGR